MKETRNISTNLTSTATSLANNATKHRFILLFIILGMAVAFALLRTQGYLDITRNENRYMEESVKIKYKQINEDTLAEFSNASEDETVDVNSNFDPNRQNPFRE